MLLSTIKAYFLGSIRRLQKKRLSKQIPLAGYTPGQRSHIDDLSDEALQDLNRILDWNSFIADAKGRRFGMVAWGSKRIEPQKIPDNRIAMMNERFNLSEAHVLEVGCFEGVHTLGLLQFTSKVTAIDSRVDHVIKTMVRCSMFDKAPVVFQADIESVNLDYQKLSCDYMHHVGVLYHLKDPVSHLLSLKNYVKKGIMLDTHYALEEQADHIYSVSGQEYRYKWYMEYGKKESFSGMYDHSKWLTLKDLISCLQSAGFKNVEIVEKRSERNGPRVLMFASTI